MSVRPRLSLSSPTGSGQSRSTAGVTTMGGGSWLAGESGRDIVGPSGVLVLVRDGRLGLLDCGGVGERLQAKDAVAVPAVGRDGAVRQRGVAVDVEQLLLGKLLQNEPERHDHRLVGEDPQPRAVVVHAERVEHAAHPQRDVAPALAARRAVVELADALAAGRLVRELLADTGTGEPVEGAEVALPEPLVEGELQVEVGAV